MIGLIVLWAELHPTAVGASEPSWVLSAERAARLIRFYETGLELELVERDLTEDRALFRVGNVLLTIVPGRDGSGPGGSRLILPATDLSLARARLARLGVAFEEVTDPDGVVHGLFFDDPEGNHLGYPAPETAAAFWLRPHQTGGRTTRSDGSGTLDLAIYGALHGIWLGIALPVGAGSDSPTAIGLSVIAGGPVGAVAGHMYARHNQLSKGQARMISLGGNFGAWQGLGWSGAGDASTETVLLTGAGAGVAGLVAGAAVARFPISVGQQDLVSHAAGWGAWFGFLGTRISDQESDQSVRTMLVTSAVGLLAGGGYAVNREVRSNQVRLSTLGGLLGTAIGFGVDLLVQVDDEKTVFTIPAVTGALGIVSAAYLTRERVPSWSQAAGTDPRSAQFRVHDPHGWENLRVIAPGLGRDPRGDLRMELLRLQF